MRTAGFIARYLAQIWKHHFRSFGSKRPDPPLSNRRIGTCHNAVFRARHDQLTNTLARTKRGFFY
jgi:hypothetical protein